MKEVTKYEAYDGTLFDSAGECAMHEASVESKDEESLKRFLCTYNGKHLLEKHSLDQHGVWEVLGEDPNCDLGGHHHNPYLFTARGKLVNVIKKAVKTEGFWQWGGGGKITSKCIEEIEEV